VRKALEFAKRSRAQRSLDTQQEPCTSRNTPDSPLQMVELYGRLTRCLAKLPKHQATVFVLSRFEGLSGEKVAEILGCSQGTVRVRLCSESGRCGRGTARRPNSFFYVYASRQSVVHII
jgi:RNA polymerase sigma factor (sigma-70 family)